MQEAGATARRGRLGGTLTHCYFGGKKYCDGWKKKGGDFPQ
jgi:hypothetical protein